MNLNKTPSLTFPYHPVFQEFYNTLWFDLYLKLKWQIISNLYNRNSWPFYGHTPKFELFERLQKPFADEFYLKKSLLQFSRFSFNFYFICADACKNPLAHCCNSYSNQSLDLQSKYIFKLIKAYRSIITNFKMLHLLWNI